MILMTAIFLACWGDKSSDTATVVQRDQDNVNSQNDSDDSDSDSDDSASDTGMVNISSGVISGGIDIQLYRDTVQGDREILLWEEAYPQNTFPFGKLYVGAFFYNAAGLPVYIAADVIEDPQPANNRYELNIEINADFTNEIRIFAVLDYYQDNITGTDEPIGGYPQGIAISENFSATDIDFSVLSPMYQAREPCGTYQNGENRSVIIEGTAFVTDPYTGGDAVTYLMLPGGIGPVASTQMTPVPLTDGSMPGIFAEGTYQIEGENNALEVCEDIGYASLVGCWDRNMNGMFEPLDMYGSYVISGTTQNANPISIKYSDFSGYEVKIPLSGSSGLRLLPFMSISGTVSANGLFDDMAFGGRLHIAALKFRPQGSISVSDIEDVQSYDIQTYEWEEIQGKTVVPFTLMAPKETITYLWAYIDVDSNGYVNESLEPIASAGEDDNGKFPTGNVNIDGVEMTLTIMEE